mgnify:CR=1 FL=1
MGFTPGLGSGGMGGFNMFTGSHYKSNRPGRRVGAPRKSLWKKEITKIKRDWMWLIPGAQGPKVGFKLWKAYKTSKGGKLAAKVDRTLDRINIRVFGRRYSKLKPKTRKGIKVGQTQLVGQGLTVVGDKMLRDLGLEFEKSPTGHPTGIRRMRWFDKKKRYYRKRRY